MSTTAPFHHHRQMSYGHHGHSRLEAMSAMMTSSDAASTSASSRAASRSTSHSGMRSPAPRPTSAAQARRKSLQVVDRRAAIYKSNSPNGFGLGSSMGFVSQRSISPAVRSQNGLNAVSTGGSGGEEQGAYERLLWQNEHDENARREMAFGKRIGFYRFKSELGTGNFSKVKLATNLLTKDRVAVKLIDKTKLDAKTQRMLVREIQIMDKLAHPCLIRLYEVSETVTGLQLIMEYAPGGELFARLTEEGPYEEARAKFIFAQVASGVDYMHSNLFIHRDLKAENVFFAAGRDVVKVGDFGFATQVSRVDQQLNTFCGSPPYAAPELFQDDHYMGPSVDIWALGILLYFMVTGVMPFKGGSVAALKSAILDGKFLIPEFLSTDCVDIISGILRRKPEWRLTMAQIRASRFLSDVPWPEPDYVYQSLPTKPHLIRDEAADRPHYESVVRERLAADFGISGQKLDSHIERGARSPVIGAYRILMHKAVGGVPSAESRAGSSRDPSSVANGGQRSNPQGGPRRQATTVDKNVKKKSKTCSIL